MKILTGFVLGSLLSVTSFAANDHLTCQLGYVLADSTQVAVVSKLIPVDFAVTSSGNLEDADHKFAVIFAPIEKSTTGTLMLIQMLNPKGINPQVQAVIGIGGSVVFAFPPTKAQTYNKQNVLAVAATCKLES